MPLLLIMPLFITGILCLLNNALAFMGKVVWPRLIWIHSCHSLYVCNISYTQAYFLELMFSCFYRPWFDIGLVLKWGGQMLVKCLTKAREIIGGFQSKGSY